MTHTPTDQPTRRASGAVVPVLAFVGIVVAVMQTLLVPVIKDLPQLLGTEPGNATWVITSTLLSGAVATPITGRLGDLSLGAVAPSTVQPATAEDPTEAQAVAAVAGVVT